jgi:hypothetical protein
MALGVRKKNINISVSDDMTPREMPLNIPLLVP